MIYDRAEAQEKRYYKDKKQQPPREISSATRMRGVIQPDTGRRTESVKLSTPQTTTSGRRSNSMELFEDRVRDTIERTPGGDRFPSPAWGPVSSPKGRGFRMPSEVNYSPKGKEIGSSDHGEDRGDFDPMNEATMDKLLNRLISRINDRSSRARSSGRTGRSVSFAGVD